MRKELEEKLIKKFPNALKGYSKSPKESLMCFGFEYGDGWYELTEKLLTLLTKLDPNVELVQAKEKFGEMTIYLLTTSSEALDLTEEYAEKSRSVCEVCGKKGEIRNHFGWLKTLCDEHYIEWIR